MLIVVQGFTSAVPAMVAFQVVNPIIVMVCMSTLNKSLPQVEAVAETGGEVVVKA